MTIGNGLQIPYYLYFVFVILPMFIVISKEVSHFQHEK